jgi:hypothetical protein
LEGIGFQGSEGYPPPKRGRAVFVGIASLLIVLAATVAITAAVLSSGGGAKSAPAGFSPHRNVKQVTTGFLRAWQHDDLGQAAQYTSDPVAAQKALDAYWRYLHVRKLIVTLLPTTGSATPARSSLSTGYIHDNYVHDLQSFIPDGSSSYEHLDDLISDGGSGLTVTHNTMLDQFSPQLGASASIGLFDDSSPVTNTTVNDNFMAGGAFALYPGGGSSSQGIPLPTTCSRRCTGRMAGITAPMPLSTGIADRATPGREIPGRTDPTPARR